MLKNVGLTRSSNDKWIMGVCGGIAEKFAVKPLWVRLGVIAVAILPAGLGIPPVVLIYIALSILLPAE